MTEVVEPALYTTVYTGTLGVAKTVQATLEAAGFQTFMPGENMKTLDPFDTGANCLIAAVQVPGPDAQSALEFLADSRVESSDDEVSDAERQLIVAASRIRWSLALQLMLVVPLPWLFAPRYLRLAASAEVRPPNHKTILALLGISALVFLVYATVFGITWWAYLRSA